MNRKDGTAKLIDDSTNEGEFAHYSLAHPLAYEVSQNDMGNWCLWENDKAGVHLRCVGVFVQRNDAELASLVFIAGQERKAHHLPLALQLISGHIAIHVGSFELHAGESGKRVALLQGSKATVDGNPLPRFSSMRISVDQKTPWDVRLEFYP